MRTERRALLVLSSLLLATVGARCVASSEAPRLTVPVVAAGGAFAPFTTDLGYRVELASVRLSLSDLAFTAAGEAHATRSRGLLDWLSPSARAHPGHYQAGEVVGELNGVFDVSWGIAEDAMAMGDADLIAIRYEALNFVFGQGLEPEGHTAELVGAATRDGRTVSFVIRIAAPAGRALVGAPFEADLAGADAGVIAFSFFPVDPLEGDTVLDGLDFLAWVGPADTELVVAPEVAEVEDAYNLVRRTFLTHDHFGASFREQP